VPIGLVLGAAHRSTRATKDLVTNVHEKEVKRGETRETGPKLMAGSFRINSTELPSEAVIFGGSAAMQAVRSRVGSIVNGRSPVLIQGEVGTGKELVARFMHSRSNRCDAPFVKASCAAAYPGLLERYLLGYEKSSVPGAKVGRRGLLEIAQGGTLFLAEIEEMDWALQGKLARLLRDGSFSRVGGSEKRRVDVRLICSTEVELLTAVSDGGFRQDLFCCFASECLRLLALRERKEDLPMLWDFFAQKLAKKFGKNAPRLTPQLLRVLKEWNWPGNLRELENGVARAIILSDENALGAELRRQIARKKRITIEELEADPGGDSPHHPMLRVSDGAAAKAFQVMDWNTGNPLDDSVASAEWPHRMHRSSGTLRKRWHRRSHPPVR